MSGHRRLLWVLASGRQAGRKIDQLNILQATFLAMRRAVEQMEQQFGLTPDLVLVDGNRDPHLSLQTRAVVRATEPAPASRRPQFWLR